MWTGTFTEKTSAQDEVEVARYSRESFKPGRGAEPVMGRVGRARTAESRDSAGQAGVAGGVASFQQLL